MQPLSPFETVYMTDPLCQDKLNFNIEVARSRDRRGAGKAKAVLPPARIRKTPSLQSRDRVACKQDAEQFAQCKQPPRRAPGPARHRRCRTVRPCPGPALEPLASALANSTQTGSRPAESSASWRCALGASGIDSESLDTHNAQPTDNVRSPVALNFQRPFGPTPSFGCVHLVPLDCY